MNTWSNFLSKKLREAKWLLLLFNTFERLEREVLESLQSLLLPVYAIGSLHLLMKHVDDKTLEDLRSNLWKEENRPLMWLDSKKLNSVVYVNFGSITLMTPGQLIEFAWGLANSQLDFLWILRPDIVSGEKVVLPPKFLEEIKERGMLASWCPQERLEVSSLTVDGIRHSKVLAVKCQFLL